MKDAMKTTTKHTAEPWILSQSNADAVVLTDDNGDIAFLEKFDADAPAGILGASERRALRIMACVNACAGMEDPAKAIADARRAMDGLLSNAVSCDAALIAELYRARLALVA